MPTHIQDQELLWRYLREGDEAAFSVLVERHLDLVYGAAFRVLNQRSLAEEIAQSVFIALARRAGSLLRHPSVAGWLYHTAVNQARQCYRAEKRQHLREQAVAQLEDNVLSKTPHPLGPVLDEALLDLGPAERELLVLRYFEDKSLREVAAALGIGEDAAQKRVSKALDALVRQFRRRGCTACTAVLGAEALRAGVHLGPAGLTASVGKAALSAGGVPWLGSWGARLLGLGKPQAAVLCAALLLVPLVWQGARLRALREERQRLERLLGEWGMRQDEVARDRAEAGRQLQRVSRTLAQQQAPPSRPLALNHAALGAVDARLFRWEESAKYIRVPKETLKGMSFDGKDLPWSALGMPEAERVMTAEGQVSATLLDALGLTGEQQGALAEYIQACIQQYRAYAESRAAIVGGAEALPPGTPEMVRTNADTRVWMLPKLAEEVAVWKGEFVKGVAGLIGTERAQVLFEQASQDNSLERVFQDFGANQPLIVVTPQPDGRCALGRSFFRRGRRLWAASGAGGIAISTILAPPGQGGGEVASVLERSMPAALSEYLRQWQQVHPEAMVEPKSPSTDHP